MNNQQKIALITFIAILISITVTVVLFMQKLQVIESQKHDAYGATGNGLKVVVKIKYSDYIKEHGIGKAYFKFYDDSKDVIKTKDLSKKFPKSVTLKFPSGAVDVGEKFIVVLNSYKCDDATQVSGVNGPSKSPEKVKMRFPC
jgi:hypothetical protein